MNWRKCINSLFVGIGFLVILGFTTCIPVKKATNSNTANNQDSISVYVVDQGYHTSLIVPVKSTAHDWTGYFPKLPEKPAYWELSWGDRDYYTGNFSLLIGMKALFLPTDAVMHVSALRKDPSALLSESSFVKIRIPREDLQLLLSWIDDSFYKESNKPVYMQDGLFANSNFYLARGTYTFIFNCNNWVNRGLRKAGLRTPLWGGFPKMVMMYLSKD